MGAEFIKNKFNPKHSNVIAWAETNADKDGGEPIDFRKKSLEGGN